MHPLKHHATTETLTLAGHQVVIEADAGLGSGFTDDFYAAAGAEILDAADEIWSWAGGPLAYTIRRLPSG